jgi:hypothetical protein
MAFHDAETLIAPEFAPEGVLVAEGRIELPTLGL